MKELELKKLRYYLFSGEGVPTEHQEIYDKCYALWKKVWTQTLIDLKSPQKLFSDGFTRQTKIGCLFYEDKCIAMSSFRDVDFSFQAQREDSLLNAWNPEAFELLLADGPRVCIATYLTVDPDYRGNIAPDLTAKLLIVLLCSKYIVNSDCDVMTGTMRCNRGTDKSAYTSGARFIQKAEMYGVEVDLVGFFKKEIIKSQEQHSHLWSESLWKNKVELPLPQVTTTRTKKVA